MLRIKPEVDLKELRKYGLEKIEDYNIEDFKQIVMDGEDFDGWIEIRGLKIWRETYYSTCFELDELYDLITAGLVEKVEE